MLSDCRFKIEKNVLIDLEMHEKSYTKGTKKDVKDRFLTHDQFRSVVTDNATVSDQQNTKRWMDPDDIYTRAHRHCTTRMGYSGVQQGIAEYSGVQRI